MDYTGVAADKDAAEVQGVTADLLGMGVVSVKRIGGSGNNRVYCVQTENFNKYVAKFYFRHSSDKRDRLQAEFSSFSFLWAQGISDIPQPVAVNRDKSCAIYKFIEGNKMTAEDIRDRDMGHAVDFLGRLKRLNQKVYSRNMPAASDACFSVQAVIASVEGRLNRFAEVKEKGSEYIELESFLKNDLKPFLEVLRQWAQRQCSFKDIFFEEEIPLQQWTLSPSDFGFHNAIRGADDRIVFLDFEYFGWDDPAKTTVDLLLHPAMALSDQMKKIFVCGMLNTFWDNPSLADRIRIVYPLFGLKWCLILLNEFIPRDLERRNFAGMHLEALKNVRQEQLQKARHMLTLMKETYQDFPYLKGEKR